MIEIRLPKPGPEIENATITKWECAEGDKILVGGILAIIKTPIGSFKVAAEEQGILDQILQPEGSVIDFDEPIAILHPELSISDFPNIAEEDENTMPLPIEGIEETIEASDPPTEVGPKEQTEDTAEEAESEEVSNGEIPFEPTEEPIALSLDKTEVSEPVEETIAAPVETGQGVEVSPAAQKIAERHGIDLTTIQGTGDDGKILYIDVEKVIVEAQESQTQAPDEPVKPEEPELSVEPEQKTPVLEEPVPEEPEQAPEEIAMDEPIPQPQQPEPAQSSESEQIKEIKLEEVAKPFPDFDEISVQFHLAKKDDLIIPFNSIKKSFSDLQGEGARTVPLIHLGVEIDCTDLEKWIASFNQRSKASVTMLDLIVKASGHALALIPEMNAYVRPDRLILKRSINIGITTTVDEGVVTPVIPDVYHKSLVKVSEVAAKNYDLATSTKVVLDYDTTFTISSLSDMGVKRFLTPIMPPQTAALSIGALQKRVVPVEDFIGVRQIMEMNLACDYRAIDSKGAASFLNIIKKNLESLEIEGEDPDWLKGNEQLRLI